ncbi:MAG: heavy metal-binding domain-containing protein [Alphaproteobacteria bacterium]|nr:heavy metal-binding domain-containing protein [Alphaproteobacteria bacterium]
MKITTTETVAGRMVEETLGVVRASVLWSRRIMKFNHGGLRGLSYTTMEEMAEGLQQAKEGAEAKILTQAKVLGADAIISLKLEIMELSDGLFQAVATGTAVKTASLPQAMPAFGNAANDDDAFSAIPVFDKPAIRLVSSLMH